MVLALKVLNFHGPYIPAVQSFAVTPACNVAVFISYTFGFFLFFKESTGIIHDSVMPFFEFF